MNDEPRIEGSEFARVAGACLIIRAALPPRLHPAFALIEEAALKHAVFACNPDESGELAEVHELRPA